MKSLTVILDGFSYAVVKRFKDGGGFKDFERPCKVIAPYPTLTDLCIQDLLQGEPCSGMEAVYFDRKKGTLSGSVWSYLRFRNQPYSKILDFRSPSLVDGLSYIAPWLAFTMELNALKRQFLGSQQEDFKAYLVSTAGISTKYAADGQLECLRRIETFIAELKAHTKGSLTITLLSDHGHSYCASRLSPIEKVLKRRGWHFTKTLASANDVVYSSFGLVNYASFATLNPPKLAKDLLAVPGVEITSFVDNESIIVSSVDGATARVRRSDQACSYEPLNGDPLKLLPLLGSLLAQGSYYGDDIILKLTADHQYPAPLERLWRAHFGLVDSPPHVIASLGDEWHSGSAFLNFLATVKSTHGSLNRTNSQAVAISTETGLPPVTRSRQILDYLKLKHPHA